MFYSNLENIKKNPASVMESIIIAHNIQSRMKTIDTEENLVSNEVNFESEKIFKGKMENIEKANNPYFHTQCIEIEENFLNSVESYNVYTRKNSEVMNGINSMFSNQKKNIASLLQILEGCMEIFESTTNHYNSEMESLKSSNRYLLFEILHRLKNIHACMERAKSSISDIKDMNALLDDYIMSTFPINTEGLMNSLELNEILILGICGMLADIAELCRLILTDDPSILHFLFQIPVMESD